MSQDLLANPFVGSVIVDKEYLTTWGRRIKIVGYVKGSQDLVVYSREGFHFHVDTGKSTCGRRSLVQLAPSDEIKYWEVRLMQVLQANPNIADLSVLLGVDAYKNIGERMIVLEEWDDAPTPPDDMPEEIDEAAVTIEVRDVEITCGDGCCDYLSQAYYVDDEHIVTTPQEDQALIEILKHFGIAAKLVYKDIDGEITAEMD